MKPLKDFIQEYDTIPATLIIIVITTIITTAMQSLKSNEGKQR